MPRPSSERGLADVRSLVDDAKRRLEEDLRRVDRAVSANPPADDLHAAVFEAIGLARRDALAAFGRIFKLDDTSPERQLALTWLSLAASALATTHAALRAERVSPATAGTKRRLAQQRLAGIWKAFLELDRALGCPYGCGKR
jgi:hypothetical protein